MNIWHNVSPERIKPEDFLAVIEITRGDKKKYELDKETGCIILDRILYTSMQYPANYGFIPRTLADDGDPLDVLVLCNEPIDPLVLVECYPIGVLTMLDGGKNVLLEIEPQGALKVKKLFEEAVLMFIAPPSMKVLKQRLEDRGRETAEQIEERLEAAKWELSQSTKYDCIFVNDELGECVREVEETMRDKVQKRNLVDKLLAENY